MLSYSALQASAYPRSIVMENRDKLGQVDMAAIAVFYDLFWRAHHVEHPRPARSTV